MSCRQRGETRVDGSLSLFTAKTAAHSRRFDNYLVRLDAKDMGDQVLNLRGMLRRRSDLHRCVFPGASDGGLSLKIEMVLTAKPEIALPAVRGCL